MVFRNLILKKIKHNLNFLILSVYCFLNLKIVDLNLINLVNFIKKT